MKLGESELARLGDDELVEYAVSHRERGDADEARLALMIFAFGMEGPVRAFVRNKLDSHPNVVVDEIAERALEDAVRSIGDLRGGTGAEARGFVFKMRGCGSSTSTARARSTPRHSRTCWAMGTPAQGGPMERTTWSAPGC